MKTAVLANRKGVGLWCKSRLAQRFMLYWAHLLAVADRQRLRHLTTATEIFDAIVEQLQLATNGGNLRSIISIFAPDLPEQLGIRVWNPQLIRYAGYSQPNGTSIGDPAQTEFTKICQHFGWQGQGIQSDVLPLIVQMPGQKPQWFELPKAAVMEVPTLSSETIRE